MQRKKDDRAIEDGIEEENQIFTYEWVREDFELERKENLSIYSM